ncbi:RICIN domain-containing protein [Streptomyces sp. NPDC057638]|uniref:RICIN domain-containing protein n=1 Tax=Streptomyces sp. NPDC057638 TaxID=3346190 RepID=UPI0036A530C2
MRKPVTAALSVSAAALLLTAAAVPAQAAPPLGYTYQIKASHSGLCLDIENTSTARDAALVQQPCDTSRPSQRFLIRQAYSNYPDAFEVRTFAGLCIARQNSSQDFHGQKLSQWNCDGPNVHTQLFRFRDGFASGGTGFETHNLNPFTGRLQPSGSCWDVWGATNAAGASLKTHTYCVPSAGNHSFVLTRA